MPDLSRLKQLLAAQLPVSIVDAAILTPARVERVRQWHDQAFAVIRGVLDEAEVAYSIPAVKIALRGDMPGLTCGQEITVTTHSGRRLVIASVGSTTIHVEALPMIRIALGDDGPTLVRDEREGEVAQSQSLTADSFVSLLERWASGQL